MTVLYHGTNVRFEMPDVDDYENGDLTIEEVEQKLITAQFKAFQYSFHVPSAIKYLHPKGEVK